MRTARESLPYILSTLWLRATYLVRYGTQWHVFTFHAIPYNTMFAELIPSRVCLLNIFVYQCMYQIVHKRATRPCQTSLSTLLFGSFILPVYRGSVLATFTTTSNEACKGDNALSYDSLSPLYLPPRPLSSFARFFFVNPPYPPPQLVSMCVSLKIRDRLGAPEASFLVLQKLGGYPRQPCRADRC